MRWTDALFYFALGAVALPFFVGLGYVLCVLRENTWAKRRYQWGELEDWVGEGALGNRASRDKEVEHES